MPVAAAMTPVEFVPIDRIKTTNRYLRLDTKIDELKRSIDGIGLISPLVINEQEELVAGGRRYSAMRELGYGEVPVVRVTMNPLEQELLSIDENLQRKALSGLELEAALRRGKEVYDELFGAEEESLPEEVPAYEAEPVDEASAAAPAPAASTPRRGFIAEAAEKIGMSERAIEAAINRETSSAESVKEARRSGELGVRSTTDLVTLAKEDQTRLLPYIRGKTYKEAQAILKAARDNGVEAAIAYAEAEDETTPEFNKLREQIARTRKQAQALADRSAVYTGADADRFRKECEALVESVEALMAAQQQQSNDPYAAPEMA